MAAKLLICNFLALIIALHHVEALNYVVTLPNMLRLGVQETIGISISGNPNPVQVQIYLQDQGRRNQFSAATFSVTNGIAVMRTISVNPGDIPDFQTSSRVMVYVVVKATKGEFPTKEALVPVTRESGYTFIQTDKPLYLPNQKVKIRILHLNEKMLPNPDSFSLEIQNPKNARVFHKEIIPHKTRITEDLFGLSEYPVIGNWTVVVRYGYQKSLNTTVQIEVKKYVLPTFSVLIEPPKRILSNAAAITGKVKARYVYGKPVQGIVHLKYEIRSLAGHVIPIGEDRGNQLDNDGIFDFKVNVQKYIKNKNLPWFPDVNGNLFVVEATVMEAATGKKESAIDGTSVFTTSPYVIFFTRSRKDFKPGVPYQLQVNVYYANGEPIDQPVNVRIEIAVAIRRGHPNRALKQHPVRQTDNQGRVMFQFDTISTDEQLQFTVKSADPTVPIENQASAKLPVVRYTSPSPVSGSYVWIPAPQDDITFKVGKTFQTSVIIYPTDVQTSLYFVVVARGKIILFDEVPSVGLARTVQFLVTPTMSPSSRLIVFAIKQGKIIADSMRIEVENTCNYNGGKNLRLSAPSESVKPTGSVSLEIHGEPESYIGLVAVDEALYALNRQHLLSPAKMFSKMESHDLGCGPGGGENAEAVFRNAGVLILSNAEIGAHGRNNDGCNPKSRSKRAVPEEVMERVNDYTDDETRACCELGFQRGPEDKNCTQRAEIILEVEGKENCSQAFLDCCQREIVYQQKYMSVARSSLTAIPEITSHEDLIANFEKEALGSVRTIFPETWFFNTIQMGSGQCKGADTSDAICRVPYVAPHSITTWNVQAVGISAKTGMCVAEPLKIRVFKEMFIQLDLPYAAVRGEQIEVPATVFNYGSMNVTFTVYMFGAEGLCMGAGDGERSELFRIEVPANGAKTVKFPVMPLEVTEYPIRVVALSTEGSDAIEKKLKVVAEGVQKDRFISRMLDPSGFYHQKSKREISQGGIVEDFDKQARKHMIGIELDMPDNYIPGSGRCSVSVVGSAVGQAVNTTLTGSIKDFILLPTGCYYQNLGKLAPLVYTMLYLKKTNQMTAAAESAGYNHMKTGYGTQVGHIQSGSGAFGVWSNTASSVLLTAVATRVFCQAATFISIDQVVTCRAANWLLTKQTITGSFLNDYGNHYISGEITNEIAMTAYVVIAMQECSQCDSQAKTITVAKALSFLEERLDSLTQPFDVTITAYALSLGRSQRAIDAYQKLKHIAVYDESASTRWWNLPATDSSGKPWIYTKRASAAAVEATGYALLTALNNDDVEYSHPIANWINQQRTPTGSFVTIQDTIVALQALATYSAVAKFPLLDMKCNITNSINTRSRRNIVLNKHNALQLHDVDVPLETTDTKLLVIAQGSGLASVSVAMHYNVYKRVEDECKFELTVTSSEVKEEIKITQHRPKGSSRSGLPDVTLRRISHGNQQDTTEYDVVNKGKDLHVVRLKICIRYLSDRPANMSILDIGLFTGYQPIKEDLDKLTSDPEQSKVRFYESSERSVILYLDDVPNIKKHCLELGTRRDIVVGNVQPTAVKIYNYDEPDEACTKFYGPGKNSPMLQHICKGRECTCIEGQCPKEKPFAEKKTFDSLLEFACERHHFVWNVTFIEMWKEENLKDYEENVKHYVVRVDEVLKAGQQSKADIINANQGIVSFSLRKDCEHPKMIPNQAYIIMGNDGIQYKTEEDETKFMYVFDKGTSVYHTTRIKLKPKPEQALEKLFLRVGNRLRNAGCST